MFFTVRQRVEEDGGVFFLAIEVGPELRDWRVSVTEKNGRVEDGSNRGIWCYTLPEN